MSRMWVKKYLSIISCLFILLGCGSHVSREIIPDYDEKGVRLVALLPIKNKTQDSQAADIVRKAILEELYFKGYPKIPFNVIDDKLTKIYGTVSFEDNNIPPETVGEVLGVDAVMYCTLEEWKTSYIVICAPTTVAASFELRNAKTGETLWSTNYSVVKRNYDFTGKGLEMKSRQTCELAALEVVSKSMSTLPNGPDFLGSTAPKKNGFLGLW